MAKKLKIWNGASWEDVTFAITPPNTAVTNSFTTNQVIDASTSVAALRITQRGAGESFRVEDETNPDSSPFVIDAAGQVYVGSVNAASKSSTTRQYLNVGGTSGTGVLQLLDAGSTSSLTGLIEFHDLQNTANSGGTRNAYIAAFVDGTTSANNRGGTLSFATKQDGVSNAALPRMTIDNIGNVGIGASSPKLRFQVSSSINSTSMPTLGTASGTFYSTGLDSNYGLLSGVSSSTGAVWFQAQRTDGNATAYNILLNPSGGNVGIGVTEPLFKIQTYNDLSSATVGTQALVFQAQVANGNNDFLKLYQERENSTASWGGAAWILRRHVDATPMGGIKWAPSEWNPIAIYGAPNDRSIRTTYISTGTPSGGNDGDMWATYV